MNQNLHLLIPQLFKNEQTYVEGRVENYLSSRIYWKLIAF